MRITLKQLEIFKTIAQSGSVIKAAEKLYLTQSACSMGLASLEEQLGAPLFDRIGKRLLLNQNGSALLIKAVNILEEVQEVEQNLSNTQAKGLIRIGASTTAGNYLLPALLSKFKAKNPDVDISMIIANTEEIAQRIMNFDLDVGYVEGDVSGNALQQTIWKKDELVIVAGYQHPLVKKKQVTLADLLKSEWILREAGSGTRIQLEAAIKSQIQPIMIINQIEAIKQVVATNLGISCLSQTAVNDLVKLKKLAIIKTPFLSLHREFKCLIHKNKYQTQLLKKLLQFLETR